MHADNKFEEVVRYQAFICSIECYDEKALKPKLRSIRRMEKWLADRFAAGSSIEWWSVTPVLLAAMLLDVRRRGRTAPAGFLAQLKWIRDHLGAPLPVGHPVVYDFRINPQPGLLRQADVLQLCQL